MLGYKQVSVINVFVNDTIYSLAYSQARFAVRVNIFISMKVTVEGRLFHPTVSTLKDNFVTVKVLSSKKSAIEQYEKKLYPTSFRVIDKMYPLWGKKVTVTLSPTSSVPLVTAVHLTPSITN